MLFNELKSFDQTENLVNWSTNRQIIDRNLSQILLSIDDKQSSQSDTTIRFKENTVTSGNLFGKVAQQRIVETT